MLNGFENQWLLFKNILKCNTHTQKKFFYRVSYFNLNQTKYSMLKEFNVNLDLTLIFSLKKCLTCSPDLNSIEYIKNINITEVLKYFQYGKFKKKIEVIE